MGAMSGVTPTRAVRSGLSFLDSYQFPTSVEPFTPVLRDTPSPRPPAYGICDDNAGPHRPSHAGVNPLPQ